MALSETKLYDLLCDCGDAQFDYIEMQLQLNSSFIRKEVAATRAREIINQLKARDQFNWKQKLAAALNKAMNTTGNYLLQRLELLKRFLVEQPPEVGGAVENAGTVKELRAELEECGGLKEPELIKVRGTLFPAALLAAGWWERKKEDKTFSIEWKNPLQRWLFQGFDLWAPSWDISWDFESAAGAAGRPCIAQLTDGDEADSLPVIVPPGKVQKLRDEFRDSWGGFECEVHGLLGHRFQLEEKRRLPKGYKGEPMDYCIVLEDDNKKHRILRTRARTELYSGYLWKCVAPREWLKDAKQVGLDDVYFIWEHTNFAAPDAVAYNLDGLARKEALIATRHPGSELVLLQKSHAIVPGKPQWAAQDFYAVLLDEGRVI